MKQVKIMIITLKNKFENVAVFANVAGGVVVVYFAHFFILLKIKIDTKFLCN